MKIELLVYKSKFKITEQEKEDYFKWWWLPEPEIRTKEDIDARFKKLRLRIDWTKKIGNKYSHRFISCDKWTLNSVINEITIL